MLTRIGTPVASAVAAFALAIALSGAAVGVALVADTTALDFLRQMVKGGS